MVANRPGTILYALGMTQHTTAVQGIRAFTILQLLLGNIGKPGGGVNALRGEPNVQGACDMGRAEQLPAGYLNWPVHTEPDARGLDAEQRHRAQEVARSTCSRRSSATRRRPRTTSPTSGCPRRTPARTTAPSASSRARWPAP
jgi:anaerobic selenocysteine-containing dehydrogenase